jgi:hypothetical protein
VASSAITPETVIQARVVTVVDRVPGASLVVDAAAGAGSLSLDNVFDFEELGGSATIADATHSEEVADTALDDDAGTLTLSGVLVNSYLGDGETYVSANAAGVEKSALVVRDDVDDEQILVRVPHRWYDVLPEGVRDPGEGEAITARFDGVDWLLEDILGQTPSADAAYLNPDTIPPAPPDGVPPSSSPAPVVAGGIGSLFVSWLPITNADPVTYEVHISTTTGFTPGPTTLSQTTDGSQAVIDHLPDGTVLDPTGATTYYVKIVAVDADGSAAASSQASGAPRQITGPDIAVGAVTAREVLTNALTADRLASTLLLSNLIQTASEGQRVEISPGGITLFASDGSELVSIPTDPDKSPTFRGDVVTGGLQVLGNMLIQGADNVMDKGSVLTLHAKTADPGTAPTIGFEYDSDPLPSPMGDETQIVGLDFDTNGNGSTTDTLLFVGYGATSSVTLYECSAARPVTILRSQALFPASNMAGSGTALYGVARQGGYIWVLYKSSVGGNITLRAFDATTLAGAGTTTIAVTGATDQGMALGSDGTNLLVMLWASSSNGADKKVYPVSISGSTPTVGSPFTLTGGVQRTTTSGLGGITGRDGTHYTTVTKLQSAGKNYSVFEQFLQSTKALDTADGSVWTPDAVNLSSNNVTELWKGVAYDGSQFIGSSVFSALIQRYSTWVWTPGSNGDKWWIGYTWRHAAEPFESGVSPLSSIVLNGAAVGIGRLGLSSRIPMRGQLRITTPALPGDADTARIYELPSSTSPATSSMKLQTPASSVYTAFGNTFIQRAYASGGAAPDTAHPFPGGTSTIQGDTVAAAVTAVWKLGGDGAFLLTRTTSAQRPGSPVEGDFRYNEDLSVPEFYDGAGWKGAAVSLVSATVNLPSTAAHSSGNIANVSIPGLRVGDLCFHIGASTNDGIPFHIRTQSICSVAGQIRIDFFNADSVTNDPASTTHYFLVVRIG